MAKIVLPPVTNTAMLSTINQNFADVVSEFQNKVFYRDNPVGETNTVKNDLDMDGNDIFNVGRLDTEELFVAGEDFRDLVGSVAEAIEAAEQAQASATSASISASGAALSSTNAATSAASAAESATNAGAAATTAVNIYATTLASNTGAGLVGYKLGGAANAVPRTVASKLDEVISAKDFGLATTNTGAQNVTAMNNAIAFIKGLGGGALKIPKGTYDFNSTININCDYLKIVGDGVDSTVLRITSATANFFESTAETLAGGFFDLTMTSSVTRTAGSFIRTFFWKFGKIERVQMLRWFDGIDFYGYIQVVMNDVLMRNPSGAGTSVICGHKVASGATGANLTIDNCFFRGNDDVINNLPTAVNWMKLYDCEAVWVINSDVGQYENHLLVVDPQNNTSNHFFLQTFFDGTHNGDHVFCTGAGRKAQFQFTGCWFNGAGYAFSPNIPDKMSLNAGGSGVYYMWNFTGCRFYSNTGCGAYMDTRYLDFNFNGCEFYNIGFGGGSFKWAMAFRSTSATALRTPTVTGCRFDGIGDKCILFDVNTFGHVVTGNTFTGAGFSVQNGVLLGSAAGNYDPASTGSVASASAIIISPASEYVLVTGAVNINRIEPTFPGHTIKVRCVSTPTVVDDGSNLRLAGNFVGNGNAVLTLVCEANGDWREVCRSNP